ncbi:MAG: RagB/SusD family nutrient uptake outer membrane protein [Bacteroidales bacterium]|jgi:hypothetical protein|nr:RagB/SusD family nutrient uptake outer membrane protein [Bacteroidales bacterium]
MNSFKKIHLIIISVFLLVSYNSCDQYLEPELEKQLTLEETFSKRASTERYLAHVYSFMPQDYYMVATWGYDNVNVTSLVSCSDESYFSWITSLPYLIHNNGSWNPTTGDFHTWKRYYQGINQASVFINNVGKCQDIESGQREIMKAEARFLRAYYYTLLIQQYGPVYCWRDQDPDLSLKSEEVDRHSLDYCTEFIVKELNEAAAILPERIVETIWYGRATKGAAYAVKSRYLLYMARPLFNGGNKDYMDNMVNFYGERLFPAEDKTKWDAAAAAAKQVIDLNVYFLYEDQTQSDPFQKAIKSYQGIYFEKWNNELILARWWTDYLGWQVRAAPPAVTTGFGGYSPSLKLVDTYPMAATGRFPVTGYKDNGEPVIDAASGYLEEGFVSNWVHPVDGKAMRVRTHNSCVGRDARFYASILFNGMNWINDFVAKPEVTFHTNGTSSYGNSSGDFVKNGYLFRRMNDPSVNSDAVQGGVWGNFSWPSHRLAEIYLNYAEACNEKPARDVTEGLKYWNLVRARSGLNKIEDAYPEVLTSVQTYRTLLQKERMVELAFENHRYYDIRTWMIAPQESNGKRYGRNLLATDYEASWERTDQICTPIVFEPKHYLFPIHQDQLNEMVNITQNYGW